LTLPLSPPPPGGRIRSAAGHPDPVADRTRPLALRPDGPATWVLASRAGQVMW